MYFLSSSSSSSFRVDRNVRRLLLFRVLPATSSRHCPGAVSVSLFGHENRASSTMFQNIFLGFLCTAFISCFITVRITFTNLYVSWFKPFTMLRFLSPSTLFFALQLCLRLPFPLSKAQSVMYQTFLVFIYVTIYFRKREKAPQQSIRLAHKRSSSTASASSACSESSTTSNTFKRPMKKVRKIKASMTVPNTPDMIRYLHFA